MSWLNRFLHISFTFVFENYLAKSYKNSFCNCCEAVGDKKIFPRFKTNVDSSLSKYLIEETKLKLLFFASTSDL